MLWMANTVSDTVKKLILQFSKSKVNYLLHALYPVYTLKQYNLSDCWACFTQLTLPSQAWSAIK